MNKAHNTHFRIIRVKKTIFKSGCNLDGGTIEKINTVNTSFAFLTLHTVFADFRYEFKIYQKNDKLAHTK